VRWSNWNTSNWSTHLEHIICNLRFTGFQNIFCISYFDDSFYCNLYLNYNLGQHKFFTHIFRGIIDFAKRSRLSFICKILLQSKANAYLGPEWCELSLLTFLNAFVFACYRLWLFRCVYTCSELEFGSLTVLWTEHNSERVGTGSILRRNDPSNSSTNRIDHRTRGHVAAIVAHLDAYNVTDTSTNVPWSRL